MLKLPDHDGLGRLLAFALERGAECFNEFAPFGILAGPAEVHRQSVQCQSGLIIRAGTGGINQVHDALNGCRPSVPPKLLGRLTGEFLQPPGHVVSSRLRPRSMGHAGQQRQGGKREPMRQFDGFMDGHEKLLFRLDYRCHGPRMGWLIRALA